MPWMFAGFVVGVTVLVGVPDRHLRIALGLFTAVLGIHRILNPTLHGADLEAVGHPRRGARGRGRDRLRRGRPDLRHLLSGASTTRARSARPSRR